MARTPPYIDGIAGTDGTTGAPTSAGPTIPHIFGGEILYKTRADEFIRIFCDDGYVSVVPQSDQRDIGLSAEDAHVVAGIIGLLAETLR